MVHRDYVKRKIKKGNNEVDWIFVERVICKKCNHIKRVLPDYIEPYKHYRKDIIDKFKIGEYTTDDILFENYPCDITVERWKSQKLHSL